MASKIATLRVQHLYQPNGSCRSSADMFRSSLLSLWWDAWGFVFGSFAFRKDTHVQMGLAILII